MTLEALLTQPGVQTLGRALLHFLWQGALLAGLLWIVKIMTPSSAARIRYGAATFVMLLMPVAVIVTVTQGLPGERENRAFQAHSVRPVPPASPQQAVSYARTANTPRAGFFGWFVCIWSGGVLLLSVRLGAGWLRARQLISHALPASHELEAMMTRLKLRLRVPMPVGLFTSAIVQVPTVIGWIRPYILLPVTALTGLSDTRIQALLAH